MTQAEKQTGGIPTKLSQLENDAGFIAEDGDGSGLTVGFTEAAARENIASGENTGTLMGKIKKWLADLAAAAFMQVITSYADLMAGTALDNYLIGAAAAKEGFTELNGNLNGLKFASISTSVTLLVADKQSFLGSLSDFGLPNNANVFGVFANCNWPVNVRLASNGNFYAYQIANVSDDATFILNFVVAYK